MSWQNYIDQCLMSEIDGNHLTAAAIINHGGAIWAQSANFPLYKPEEIAAIMEEFEEPGKITPKGLFLGGEKYMVTEVLPKNVIRGKKGAGGITVKKTNKALLIGIYDQPMTPDQCNSVVESIGNYLLESSL